MRAADIDTRGITAQVIQVFYHWWLHVDPASLGDGDIVVGGPNSYLQRGALVDVREVTEPFPLPLDALAADPDETSLIPSRHPMLVATYRFTPPAPADAWLPEHNGRYSVNLAPEQVSTADGRFLPRKLLGGFRVVIGERSRVFPEEAKIRVGQVSIDLPEADAALDDPVPPTVWASQIRLLFANPNVTVRWDDLRRDGRTFFVRLEAYQFPIPPPDAWPPVIIDAGDPSLDPAGAPADAAPDAAPEPRAIDRHVVTRSFQLGDLDPGEYTIVVREFDRTLARKAFVVRQDPPVDEVPPASMLRVRNVVTETGKPLSLHVVYEDRGGVDPSTIGDGDLVVLSPCFGLDVVPPRPCPWDVQGARFVSLRADADDLRRIVATYEIDPPDGGWAERHNGYYPIVLTGDAVCDRSGNCTPRRRLGGFEVAIEPSDPPRIPADAEISIDASNAEDVRASVRVDFHAPYQVVGQSIRRDGHRIFLLAEAERLAAPDAEAARTPMPAQELRYAIGALEPGDYVAAFVMNRHRYDAEEFTVDPLPPFDAKADLAVDARNPEAVHALATIRFASPHRIVSSAVERDGDRFFLSARVAPVTVTDPNTPPNPVTVGYRLGALQPGTYVATFEMNGFPFASEDFRVGPVTGPLEAEVGLRVDASGAPVKARASVDFKDPYVVLTDPGRPRIEGSRVIIDATAGRAEFVREPDGAPIVVDYDLGDLPPGDYVLIYRINGFFYAREPFWVLAQPVPARAEISVDASAQPVTAQVEVRFRDHYRIVEQGVFRLGNRLILFARAEGPLPLAAPIPPPPVTLDYDLGDLAPGEYAAVFVMNRHIYDTEPFRVRESPGFEVAVDLGVDADGDEVLAKAVVDFKNPYVIVTDQGTPVLQGATIEIRATAREVTFIREPDGDPQEFHYNLGELLPGPYQLVYFINDVPEARTAFVVPERPEPPVAHVVSIEIAQGDASWFSEVGVALLPGQRVTDWGEVRRDGNTFHVGITVEFTDGEPDETDIAPERITVFHTYVLGILDPGEYSFVASSRGQVVARKGFVVPGSAPQVRLLVENITEPKDSPHRFAVDFSDPDGLDHESIQSAGIFVTGPGGDALPTELVEYASTDDVPSTGATGVYAIRPPGGSWDADDRGIYTIGIEAAAVRDLNGNTLENGSLGGFAVRIMPDPPQPPGAEVRVDIDMNDTGVYFAKVELIPDDGAHFRVASWGQVVPFGQTLLALATVEQVAPPAEPEPPIVHTYRLGALRPGYYLFVFKTNLAHCGIAEIVVDGEVGDGGIDGWRELAFPGLSREALELVAADGSDSDIDGLSILGEYLFGTDPLRPDRPRIVPEIVTGDDGRRHLAVRYRRATLAGGVRAVIEVSRDCRTWTRPDATRTELLDRTVSIDGTEEHRICLTDPIDETGAPPFIRIVVERE